MRAEQASMAAVQQAKVRLSQEKKSTQERAYACVKEANKQASAILQQRIGTLRLQQEAAHEERLHAAMAEQHALFATYEKAVGMAARVAVAVVMGEELV